MVKVRESGSEECDINLTFGFLCGCLTLGLSPKLNVNETQMSCKCVLNEWIISASTNYGEVCMFMEVAKRYGVKMGIRVFWEM